MAKTETDLTRYLLSTTARQTLCKPADVALAKEYPLELAARIVAALARVQTRAA